MTTPQGNDRDSAWLNRANFVCVGVYLLLLAGSIFGMQRFRDWAFQTYSSEAADSEWDEWKSESERMAKGDGPVDRSAAKSDEPPALVLARDYFGVLLTGILVLGSVLFLVVVLLARGALQPSRVIVADEEAARIRTQIWIVGSSSTA